MVHVITACCNRKEITKKFILCLKNQSVQGIHLILVDDNSTDGTVEMAESMFDNITIIHGNGNLWWGGAMHQAYLWIKKQKFSPDDIVFMSNDDSVYEREYIKKACKALENAKRTLLAGNGYSIENEERFDGATYYDEKVGSYTLLPSGAYGNMCTTRSLFLKLSDYLEIGGFHPILLPHYLSDYEYTYRAYRKGFKIVSDDTVAYYSDRSKTGIKKERGLTLKELFSKKCPFNPIYKINYTLLITPIYKWPLQLYRQIRRFGTHIKMVGNKK